MKEQLDRIEKKIDALLARSTGAKASAGAVASDRDLDGEYGNPEVRGAPPKDWKGASMAGKRFSDCPPEFLDLVAELNDWRAKKDDEAGAKGETNAKGKPKDGHFARLDAMRARGWAARLRAGGGKPKAAPKRSDYDDPFGYGTGEHEAFHDQF